MSVMSDLDIILHNIVDEGIDSGFFGDCLKDYVYDSAINNYKISRSLVEPFVDAKVTNAEKEIFDDCNE